MPTYLLTWNPAKWPWGDLAHEAQILKRGKALTGQWTCGNSKSIHAGDRFFMIKQGTPPRGIVASGWVTSGVFQDTHWDAEKRRAGIRGRYVKLRFEVLLDPAKNPILGVSELTRGPLADVHWRTQMSGIRIPDQAVPALERVWSRHLEGLGMDRSSPLAPQGTSMAREEGTAYPAATGEDERQLLARITANVRIFGGKPIVRGRRLAVEHVLGLLAAGDTVEGILAGYPWLERADIQACLVYARRLVAHERIEPLEVETRS